MRAACWASLSRWSARIADFTRSVSTVSSAARSSPSSRPACMSSVSADTLRASDSSFSTRTEGWCRPRSTWLRYGWDTLVISATWRGERWARARWLRMNAPSASAWAAHGSLISHLRPLEDNSRRTVPVAGAVRRMTRRGGGLLRGRRLLGRLRRGLLRHRGGDLKYVLGELPLRGQHLAGEVEGVRDQLAGLGQLVGERHGGGRQRRRQRVNGVGPGPERINHGFLARADRVEDLRLQFLGCGTRVGHGEAP